MVSFIVLEGGEGAGKSTVAQGIATALQAHGHDVLLTREPGGTPEGSALRALLLAADAPHWDKHAELALIIAARIQHVKRVIEPALGAGKTVLCDRYLGSTLAYQGAGRGIDAALIIEMHKSLVGGLMPDMTILLDIDPRIGLARSKRRLQREKLDEARFEHLDLAFHDAVRASFLAQATNNPTLIIDAAREPALVMATILERLLACMEDVKLVE